MASSSIRRSSFLFGAIALLGIFVCPPLYEYDGITYTFFASDPVNNINPHHLFWVPWESVLLRLNSVFHVPALKLLQISGIVITALALTLYDRLLIELGAETWFAAALAFFMAFSPPFSMLSSQNLPYPYFFLFVVLFLKAFSKTPIKGENAIAGMVALAAATLFHQMAVLFVPGAFVAFRSSFPAATGGESKPSPGLTPPSPSRERAYGKDNGRGPSPFREKVAAGDRMRESWLKRAVMWILGVGLLIALPYLTLGWATGHRTVGSFATWGTAYMHEIHPLRLVWPDFFPQAIIGLSRTALQLKVWENFLAETLSPSAIFLSYTVFGFGLIAAIVWFLVRKAARAKFLFKHRPLFALSATSILLVTVFALLWEPSNFNFWVIAMFPFFVCLVLLAPSRPTKILLSAILLAMTGYNIVANHAMEIKDPQRKTFWELEFLQKHLGPHDILISFNRGITADNNYDLLFNCLEITSSNPGRAWIDDYVLPNPEPGGWQKALDEEMRDTLSEGGKVYLSNGVFQADSYREASKLDPFAAFIRQGYAGLPWKDLPRQAQVFFHRYRLREAFMFDSDLIWDLTLRRGK